MMYQTKEPQAFDPIMDEKEYQEKKKEIEVVDGEIDERVFELYGVGEQIDKAKNDHKV